MKAKNCLERKEGYNVMNKKRYFSTIVFCLLITNIVLVNVNIKSEGIYKNNISKKQLHKVHNMIKINGNDDFNAKNGVKKGIGTLEDPYIISDLEIESFFRPAISISNTDAYATIKNCVITGNKFLQKGALAGIYVTNSKNIKIENTTIKDISADFGIALISSSNNTVENCDFQKNKRGITVNGCPSGYKHFSNNNTITKCNFKKCIDGIYFCCLPSSKNNVISLCNITENSKGVCIDHCIHYTTITNCNISFNEIGVEIISASSNNYITNNIFYKNDINAFDNCRNYWDNGKKYGGNYWDGHNFSKPYIVEGNSKGIDRYPLNNDKLNRNIISFFDYTPRTAFINEGIAFDGSVSYEHKKDITYNWYVENTKIKEKRNINHIFTEPGTYNITLNITSGDISDSFTKKIKVYEKSNNTFYVLNNSKIQDVINICKPGDTIIIENGIYYENLLIDTPQIHLIGNKNTIIDGGKKDNVIKINASYVTISKIKIINSSDGKSGIRLGYPDYIIDSYKCRIDNNTFEKNSIGLCLFETECNNIENNSFSNNLNYGIYLKRSFENDIHYNNILDEDIGLKTEYASNWNNIERNNVKDSNIGIFLQISNYNNIFYNNITNNNIGIKLNSTIHPTIKYNNIFSNKEYGLIYNSIPIASKNYWGSRWGPSGLLNLFGDKVIQINEKEKEKITSLFLRYYISFPWFESPVEI